MMRLNFDNCIMYVERVDENNLKQGKATITYNNGNIEETNYIDDVKNGKTIYFFGNSCCEKFTYVNGIKQGPATYSTGREIEEYNYVDGVKTGPGKLIILFNENGFIKERNFEYINGVKTGPGTIIKQIKRNKKLISFSYIATEHVFYKNNQVNGFSVQDIFREANKYIIRYYVNGEVKFSLKVNSPGLDFGYVNEEEKFITLFKEDDILFANNIEDIKELLFKINDLNY